MEGTNWENNSSNQLEMERYLSDVSYSSQEFKIGDIHSSIFNKDISSVIDNKNDMIKEYIRRTMKHEDKKVSTIYVNTILEKVGFKYLYGITIYYLLVLISSPIGEINDFTNTTHLSITIGKSIVNNYSKLLRTELGYSKLTFREWNIKFSEIKSDIYEAIHKDDSIYAMIGSRIIEVLEHSELVRSQLFRIDRKTSQWKVYVSDPDLISISSINKPVTLPKKLPMIISPKPYSHNQAGGYLLNDEDFFEDILIEKKNMKFPSEITETNKLYFLVNGISETPFKVNQTLLEFITSEKGSELGLLLSESDLEPYTGDVSEYKTKKALSIRSKLLHQENVLAITDIFKNFSSIYFPVRLDQRGRIYCTSAYFHYQSDELSKSLILFSEAGIINKSNLDSILYLKAYGANCFGGIIGKQSMNNKIKWVDNHINDIVNYENGVLLNKAKDKLLFLAFCIEYKRFVNFYNDESQTEFKNYLPIQLDATCNGFQHISLLSNEDQLFEVLNLIQSKDNKPKDFYNFFL